MAGFGISGVEPSGSAIRELIFLVFVIEYSRDAGITILVKGKFIRKLS
jgi:hypothetical protein